MRVDPIRDRDVVQQITDMLRHDMSARGRRMYLLWVTGIYTGRRVSDILSLRVRDVYRRTHVVITEHKTGKRADIYLSPEDELYQAYAARLRGRDPDEFVFGSPRDRTRPITRRTAYRDLQRIKDMADIPEDINVGTHTMRKTFGYWYYQSTHDVASLMELFNHSSERITMIYIGIASDEKRRAYRMAAKMYRGMA